MLWGIPIDGPFIAPFQEPALRIVLFLPESLGKSIFVDMLTKLGLTCFTWQPLSVFHITMSSPQMTRYLPDVTFFLK